MVLKQKIFQGIEEKVLEEIKDFSRGKYGVIQDIQVDGGKRGTYGGQDIKTTIYVFYWEQD